jgi:HEAT repeat protein
MMWRRRIIWVLVLTFLVAMAVPYLAHWREPRYQGKRISQWLDELNSVSMEDGETVRVEAGKAVRKIGPAGLPWILRKFQSQDSRLKLKLEEWAEKQSVVHFHFSDAESERYKAALAITILGPQARDAVPELAKMLNNPELSSDAGAALAGIGRDGVPALISGLTNQNGKVREAVLVSFPPLGTNAESALPAIIASLEDPILEVRFAALWAVGSAGQNQSDLALPLLIGKFRGGDAVMRRYAVAVLSGFGTNHMAEVMPILLEALADQSPTVQSASLHVLDRFPDQARAAVPRLTELLLNDPKNCVFAASVLRKILGAEGMAQILKAFAGQPASKQTQLFLIMKQAERGLHNAPMVTELLALTRDNDERVRLLAVLALGMLNQRSELVVPRLMECLSMGDPATKSAAAEALGCFGKSAKPAIPALLEIIKQERESGQAHPMGIGSLAAAMEKEEAMFRGAYGLREDAAFRRRYGLPVLENRTDSKSGAPNAASSGTSFEWALKRIEMESAKEPSLR